MLENNCRNWLKKSILSSHDAANPITFPPIMSFICQPTINILSSKALAAV